MCRFDSFRLSEICGMLGPISLGGISGAVYNFRKKKLRNKEIASRL